MLMVMCWRYTARWVVIIVLVVVLVLAIDKLSFWSTMQNGSRTSTTRTTNSLQASVFI